MKDHLLPRKKEKNQQKTPYKLCKKVVQTNIPISVQIAYLFVSLCQVTKWQLQEQTLALKGLSRQQCDRVSNSPCTWRHPLFQVSHSHLPMQ